MGRLLELSHADALTRFKRQVVELLGLAPSLGSRYAEQDQRRILELMLDRVAQGAGGDAARYIGYA